MKIPKKCWPLGVAFLLCGFLASASALAAAPNAGGATGAGGDIPGYMVVAANLDNPAFMECVKKNTKLPGPANVVVDVQAAIACQSLMKN